MRATGWDGWQNNSPRSLKCISNTSVHEAARTWAQTVCGSAYDLHIYLKHLHPARQVRISCEVFYDISFLVRACRDLLKVCTNCSMTTAILLCPCWTRWNIPSNNLYGGRWWPSCKINIEAHYCMQSPCKYVLSKKAVCQKLITENFYWGQFRRFYLNAVILMQGPVFLHMRLCRRSNILRIFFPPAQIFEHAIHFHYLTDGGGIPKLSGCCGRGTICLAAKLIIKSNRTHKALLDMQIPVGRM